MSMGFVRILYVCMDRYSFTNLPSLDRISSIKLLSLNPVFYDQNGQACQNRWDHLILQDLSTLVTNQITDFCASAVARASDPSWS